MKTILVVDDEITVRRALERFLAPKGYQVITASDGEEAISKLQDHPVDLVLTDLGMPGLGGLEVLAAAKAVDPRPEVIVMTGQGSIDTAVDSMKNGAYDYVCKPFQLKEIDRLVADAMIRRFRNSREDKIQELHQIKSEFLAIVSHELRTPLASIIGYTSILLEQILGTLSEEQLAALKRVGLKSNELLGLINDMLELSALSTGPVQTEKGVCDLRHLVMEAAAAVEPRAQEAGLSLAWEAPEGVRFVTDGARAKKILVNLAENAVKFTPRGGVSIKAAALADKGLVEILVQDTGIGIKPEDLPVIFQDFKQLEPAMTREHGGAGIGLALAKKLAELLGGSIRVMSAPGQGSTFILTLPLVSAQAPSC